MTRKRFPSLPETSRRYVYDTQRTRLASPGLERYRRRGRAGPALLAALLAAALVALMLLLV